MDAERPPLPPFTTIEDAVRKVRMAEDAWNSRDPASVSLAYTPDSHWRNRTEFLQGRDEIVAFLTRKWAKELDYRLIKELWGFRDNRMAVRFAYEWHDESGAWFRSYGNELWEFNAQGLMRRRVASINDTPIDEGERKYHWPLGRRPDDHPSLSDLGLLKLGMTSRGLALSIDFSPSTAWRRMLPRPGSSSRTAQCAAAKRSPQGAILDQPSGSEKLSSMRSTAGFSRSRRSYRPTCFTWGIHACRASDLHFERLLP